MTLKYIIDGEIEQHIRMHISEGFSILENKDRQSGTVFIQTRKMRKDLEKRNRPGSRSGSVILKGISEG